MKRYSITFLLALHLVVSGLPLAHSAVTPGAKCTKAGAKQNYKGKVTKKVTAVSPKCPVGYKKK
jgi:hypothetical protein